MKWRKSIAPGGAVRNVRLISQAPKESRAANDGEGEQAAYERGLAEGEKRLGQQLLVQRAELAELQNGVLASLRQAVPPLIISKPA